MEKPNIVISKIDLERLEKLVDNLTLEQCPNLDELIDELNRAQVLEPNDMPGNVVTMNSSVRFKVLSTQKEFSMHLVYPKDMQGSSNTISILAPIGSALIGLQEGDKISWPKPGGGNIDVEIIKVDYQPESAGDFHL